MRGLGYPIVAAGKGKNNAFNIDATPDAYVEEATRRNMNPRMLVEFVDGSKTMVEMVAHRQRHRPRPRHPGHARPRRAARPRCTRCCAPARKAACCRARVSSISPVGKGVAPGVFAVAEMRHPRLRERMNDLQLGEGPYYTFFRPYHLTSLEVPLSAAAAVLFGQSHMRPLPVPSAEVGARAKRDLAVGETLDAIGEYCYRGFALSRADALALRRIAAGTRARRQGRLRIAKGDYLTYANCAPDEGPRSCRCAGRRTSCRAGRDEPRPSRHDREGSRGDACRGS